jgi:hypothetical protein
LCPNSSASGAANASPLKLEIRTAPAQLWFIQILMLTFIVKLFVRMLTMMAAAKAAKRAPPTQEKDISKTNEEARVDVYDMTSLYEAGRASLHKHYFL